MLVLGSQTARVGVNFIFYFGTSYFQNSGIKNPFTISVITDVVNVSSTVPGLYLVEKWGRRPLLMFGAIGEFQRGNGRVETDAHVG
jgi:hypothetical protein